MTSTSRMAIALSLMAIATGCTPADDPTADGGNGGSESATGGRSSPGGNSGAAGADATTGGAKAGGTGAGGCACAYDDPTSVSKTVTLSLDCYCQLVGCPASYAARLDWLTRNCASLYNPQVTTGCGVKSISSGWLGGSRAYFDGQTGALLAMYAWDDVPWGACSAHVYQTTLPSCSTAQVCSPCGDAGTASCG